MPWFPLGTPGKLLLKVGEALHQVGASVSPSPDPPSPAPAAPPMHHGPTPCTHHGQSSSLGRAHNNLISVKCHHLPHLLGCSLSDGVFKGFLPGPWPGWAPTSPAEISPCSLAVLRCHRAVAGAGGSRVGQCHPGLRMLPGREHVLGDFCKKKKQHKKAVGVGPCLARPFPSPAHQASIGRAPRCQGRDWETLAWLRGSCW